MTHEASMAELLTSTSDPRRSSALGFLGWSSSKEEAEEMARGDPFSTSFWVKNSQFQGKHTRSFKATLGHTWTIFFWHFHMISEMMCTLDMWDSVCDLRFDQRWLDNFWPGRLPPSCYHGSLFIVCDRFAGRIVNLTKQMTRSLFPSRFRFRFHRGVYLDRRVGRTRCVWTFSSSTCFFFLMF